MGLILNFNFGRLLQLGEKLTTARINAIVRGISANITGQVSTSDIAPGSINPTLMAPGAYAYTENCTLVASTYQVLGFPVEPTVLIPGMVLAFKADAANPGPVNLQVSGLASAAITKYGGTPLKAGDIKAKQIIVVQYTFDLLAQPTWAMVCLPANSFDPTQAPVSDVSRNLVVQNNGALPAAAVDVAADEVLLKDANGLPYLATSVLVTANIGTAGVNGLDTGALAAGTWYYIWVIYNPATNTLAALLSVSTTAPTMPAGYTFKARVGTVHAGIIGGSTTDFMTFYQQEKDVFLIDTAVFAGKVGVTVWTAISGADLTAMQALVPPIAKQARGTAGNATANGGIAIGADANGLAAVANAQFAAAVSILGYQSAAGWQTPLKTAQTIYYMMNGTTNNWRLSVSGYQI